MALARSGRGPVRVAFVTTAPITLQTFFRNQVSCLRRAGYRVHTISAPAAGKGRDNKRVPTHAIPMSREISPWADLLSLFRLFRLLRRIRPEIIQTHTPKAGLLGMIAGKWAGVPIRIFTVNGVVWSTRDGWRRKLLTFTERLSCKLATEVICVSNSLRRFLIEEKVCGEAKARVLGNGGSHGVDVEQFRPERWRDAGKSVRVSLGIPEESPVVGFFGRVVKEKGIEELAIAWRETAKSFPSAHLLLCGQAEAKDAVRNDLLAELRADRRVHFRSATIDEMPAYYAAIDICVLPSHREGLPNVALEAAAMQVPMVATRITGCVDVVQHGTTGILVEARNAQALAAALRNLLEDAPLRRRMGEAGREFVTRRFAETDVAGRLLAEYGRLTGSISPRSERAGTQAN